MIERNKALELIERAMDTDPYCPICHAPTAIQDEDGRIYLRCSSDLKPHGLLGRFGAAYLPHLRHELVDLRLGAAA